MNAPPTTTLRGERGPPPHFAGREAELSLLRRRLDIALHERDPSIEGLLLISGIPGIGKTHLIDHFIRQQAANKNVKALFLDTRALSSPERLLVLVGRAMNARVPPSLCETPLGHRQIGEVEQPARYSKCAEFASLVHDSGQIGTDGDII